MKPKLAGLALLFIFFSCGIEKILYLSPPTSKHSPTGLNDDSQKYFSFETSDKTNTAVGGYFTGFDIFYKIYENKSDYDSEYKTIERYNTNNPSDAASYLLSSMSFHKLKLASNQEPIIEGKSIDREIKFRLRQYHTEKPNLIVDGSDRGVILRYNGQNFDKISKTDADVKGSSTSIYNFYVAVWCAATGIDTHFHVTYSQLTFLGMVKY